MSVPDFVLEAVDLLALLLDQLLLIRARHGTVTLIFLPEVDLTALVRRLLRTQSGLERIDLIQCKTKVICEQMTAGLARVDVRMASGICT